MSPPASSSKLSYPVDKDDVPILPDETTISAVEPTVLKHLGCLFRILVIPGKNDRAGDRRVSPVGYPYLCPLV